MAVEQCASHCLSVSVLPVGHTNDLARSTEHCPHYVLLLSQTSQIPVNALIFNTPFVLLMTWQNPTLGFRKQERQLRTGLSGGCLRSIAQRTRSGARSYWIGFVFKTDVRGDSIEFRDY